MDGNSPKGEPKFNLPSSAQTLLRGEHEDSLASLLAHYDVLNNKISSLSSKLQALEEVLQEEKKFRQHLESELLAAKSKAEASVDVQSQFLDNMSHELRTPLNGILGMTQLMLEMPLTKDLEDFAESIHHSGQVLDGIISNMLDYSRMIQGGFQLTANTFVLLDCLEQAVGSHTDAAHEKGLALRFLAEKNVLTTIETDQTRLQQIVDILLENAIKFTNAGTITLDVSLAPSQSDIGSLSITIRDTGIGIDQKHHTLIYEPFWQVELSNARAFGGIGMGLPVCKALISLMEGELSIESSLGKGASFTLNLPVTIKQKPVVKHAKKLASLNVGLYQINGLNIRILREYLSWWDIKPIAILPSMHTKKHLAGLDIIITSHDENSSVPLKNLIPKTATSSQAPLIIGISSPDTLRPSEKNLYDILLTQPIMPLKIQEALIYAKESLKSRSLRDALDSPEKSTTSGSKILLIEPHKINQKILVHMLNSLNLEVQVISSIHHLDKIPAHDNYSAVLINITSDATLGPEAIQALKQSIKQDDTFRFIGLTSAAESELSISLAKSGISDLLMLPTSVDKIKDLLLR